MASLIVMFLVLTVLRNRDPTVIGSHGCGAASTRALETIASGARQAAEPLHLTQAEASSAVIRSTLGDERPGKMVAANTPAGIGVWVMDLTAYSSGKGLVYAVNDVAESLTIWGAETNYLPVERAAIDAIRDCVGG